jgi:hypothetical protein
MLAAAEDGGTPAMFVRPARELETQQDACQAEISMARRELAAAARTDLAGADGVWRRLADGVEAQDVDARLRARQPVADTFERIVIYRVGVRPAETPKGVIDVLLLAMGGTGTMLRIDASGKWAAAEVLAGAR